MLIFLLLGFSVQLLEFVKTKGAINDEQVIHLTHRKPSVTLDASSDKSRIVYFEGPYESLKWDMTFMCYVNKQSMPLSSIQLCCAKSVSSTAKHCETLPSNKAEGTLNCLDMEFYYIFDRFNGAKFFVQKTAMDGLFAGIIHCVVSDSEKTSVVSNGIEFRDVSFYRKQLRIDRANQLEKVPPIDINQLPYMFNCHDENSELSQWPDWMNTLSSSDSPFEWNICPVSNGLTTFTCYETKIKLSPPDIISFYNGSMYLVSKEKIMNENVALVCTSLEANEPLKIFAGGNDSSKGSYITKGLEFIEGSEIMRETFLPLSPLYSSFTFLKDTYVSEFQLNALYAEPRVGSRYQWLKNGAKLPSKGSTKYYFQLSGKSTMSMNGTYTLSLKSKVEPIHVLNFNFDISVVFTPSVVDRRCLNGLFYVMENDDYTSVCKFGAEPQAEVFVGINGQDAPTAEKLRYMLQKNLIFVNRPLSHLEIDFVQKRENEETTVHLTVTKLKRNQNFELSLRLANNVGQSRLSSSLRVVRKLIMDYV